MLTFKFQITGKNFSCANQLQKRVFFQKKKLNNLNKYQTTPYTTYLKLGEDEKTCSSKKKVKSEILFIMERKSVTVVQTLYHHETWHKGK